MKILSWQDVENLADSVAAQITKSGFVPDYLVGVATGGLIPAGLLSKRLDIPKLLVVAARREGKGPNKEVRIKYLPEAALEGKRILLIDEIAESGSTLQKIRDILEKECGVAEIRIATLGVNKDKCVSWPDFYGILQESAWVVFPWEDPEEFLEYSTEE